LVSCGQNARRRKVKRGGITKAGNSCARRILVEAAFGICTRDPREAAKGGGRTLGVANIVLSCQPLD